MFDTESLILPIEGAITNTAADKSRVAEIGSPLHKEVIEKETAYMEEVFKVFGPDGVPKNEYSSFVPSTVVEDGTTLEEIKPALAATLQKGVDYWKSMIKFTKFNPVGEAQLALNERALGYLNGERSDTRSIKQAVRQMAEMVKIYSEDQKKDRVETLYEKESRKGALWAGKLAYGKVGVVWNVGASQICDYQENFVKHADRIKDITLRDIPQQ